jgi:hypothetical protein
VINHVPEFPESVPKSMLRALRFGTDPVKVTRADFDRRSGRTVEAIRQVAEAQGVLHVAPYETFCDDTVCYTERCGAPLFMDAVHLGVLGNEILKDLVKEALREGG